MLLNDFDYELPEELIAQTPIEPRNASRLMVLDPLEKNISHRHFYDLKEFLSPGDALIFNDTRVMPARLIGHREPTGAKVEIFLLRRIDGNRWETLAKPGKKAQQGNVIRFSEELSCTILDWTEFGGRIVEFSFEGIFEEILDRLGETPLPPYIHEKLEDRERYQQGSGFCRSAHRGTPFHEGADEGAGGVWHWSWLCHPSCGAWNLQARTDGNHRRTCDA